MRKLYAGIDLHSNNIYLVVIDEEDNRLVQIKLKNDMNLILKILSPYKEELRGVVIESIFNWYWLVDGLMEKGYRVHLANPAAIQQYKGLKHAADKHSAFWLAHLLRLNLLPEGYIYPKEIRAVRDLLRKRMQLVQIRTANILSIQNLFSRNTGSKINTREIQKMARKNGEQFHSNPDLSMAIQSNLAVVAALDEQIKLLEKTVLQRVELHPEFQKLLSIDGIGKILALTIMLETGDIKRFANVGNFASYCRCVPSWRFSNGKKIGVGNSRNGNKYLAWAFVEAANFCKRYNEQAKRFYQKKKQKTKGVIAIKALAHKLARAAFYVMRDQTSFDESKLFAY